MRVILPDPIIPVCNDNAHAWKQGEFYYVSLHTTKFIFTDYLEAKSFTDKYFELMDKYHKGEWI